MSVDGKIALPSRTGVRISHDEDLRRVHELRASCDAILVGGGLVDELLVCTASMIIGGHSTPTLVAGEGIKRLEDAIRLRLQRASPVGDGILLEYTVVRE